MDRKTGLVDNLIQRLSKIPFRKRGNYATGAIVLIAVVIGLYVAAGIFRGLEAPLETTVAIEYSSGVDYYSTGYIVREETVLTAQSPITSLVLSEGQMASLGEPVAMGYRTTQDQQKQLRIAQLQDQLSQLNYADSASLAVYDKAAMDAQIRTRLLRNAADLSKGRLSDVSDSAPELKGLVIRRTAEEADLAGIRQQTQLLQEEIAGLQKEISRNVEVIRAVGSGYFSGSTDGFEAVLTPQSITALSPQQIDALSAGARVPGAVGKLVEGDTWYYLTAVPEDVVKDVAPGDTVVVDFSQALAGSLEMKVELAGDPAGGRCTLILSADRYLQEMTLARLQNADLSFLHVQGLKIPKKAVRVLEDGEVGVFVLESTSARWKEVEIIYDLGESYLVTLDKNSTENLWPGDEVILSGADDLSDGKVLL